MILIPKDLEEARDLLTLWQNPVLANQAMLDQIAYMEAFLGTDIGEEWRVLTATNVANMKADIPGEIEKEIARRTDAITLAEGEGE